MNYKLGFGMMRLPVQDDGAIDYRQSCAMVDEYLSGTVATNLSLRRSCPHRFTTRYTSSIPTRPMRLTASDSRRDLTAWKLFCRACRVWRRFATTLRLRKILCRSRRLNATCSTTPLKFSRSRIPWREVTSAFTGTRLLSRVAIPCGARDR